MSPTRLLIALVAAVLLAACAQEPTPPRVYGPPTLHLSPGDLGGFRGMSGWSATGQVHHPVSPSAFKGF